MCPRRDVRFSKYNLFKICVGHVASNPGCATSCASITDKVPVLADSHTVRGIHYTARDDAGRHTARHGGGLENYYTLRTRRPLNRHFTCTCQLAKRHHEGGVRLRELPI
jgi:hypothetical protein